MRNRIKYNMTDEISKILESKLRPGESKQEAKRLGTFQNYIYSYNTFHDYCDNAVDFGKWAHTEHHCKTVAEARKYVDEYLIMKEKQNYSAWSVKAYAAAIAKLYGCSTTEFVKTKPRRRADIKRSRGPKVRDKHFNPENHKDLVNFCLSTGLRRHEAVKVRGSDLRREGDHYVIKTQGKGGKVRTATISKDVQHIVELMKAAGDNKLFSSIPEGADCHGYRRDYATQLYLEHVRPVEKIPKKDQYICRDDLKGLILDKRAMMIVSRTLGHGRIDVIAGHYIEPEKIPDTYKPIPLKG